MIPRTSLHFCTVVAAVCIATPFVLSAQRQAAGDSASFRGTVERKGDSIGVAGAEVALPGLGRTVTTDAAGAFHLVGLTAGSQLVRIRGIGFVEKIDTVTLIAGTEVQRVFAMTAQTATLDTVHTRSEQVKYHSPALQAFEERRLSKSGGYFVSDSIMRGNENTTLANVLQSRMPGMMLQYFSEHRLAVSSRKACSGPVLLHACSGKPDCFVAVYLDGQLFFNSRIAKEVPPTAYPDLENTFPVTTLAGAEYYPSAAATPTGMRVDDDGCGSLWLWTREK